MNIETRNLLIEIEELNFKVTIDKNILLLSSLLFHTRNGYQCLSFPMPFQNLTTYGRKHNFNYNYD